MDVKILEIKGFQAAFTSMFMSKRTYNSELGEDIENVCNIVLTKDGYVNKGVRERYDYFCRLYPIFRKSTIADSIKQVNNSTIDQKQKDEIMAYQKFNTWLNLLCKMGRRHITVLRFISFSCVVTGLHRGAQDDFDSHAKRLENKIIRNSTRLATFDNNEKSEYYQNKILLLDEVLDQLNIEMPETIVKNGKTYVRSTNGYIDENYKDDKDVKRGLYPLCIPSNFVFECNLTEWAHIVKERGLGSNAHEELQHMVENINTLLEDRYSILNDEYFHSVQN